MTPRLSTTTKDPLTKVFGAGGTITWSVMIGVKLTPVVYFEKRILLGLTVKSVHVIYSASFPGLSASGPTAIHSLS
ncbi:TPA: hypothetical protein ROY01_004576 [Bacillus toyonensis]|nr:hypothetical protein [Bacillus toyonensis]